MSTVSLKLQTQSLREMAERKPYIRKLGGFEYHVLPHVYKGSTDTMLFCDVLDVKAGEDVWDIGTGTGLIALHAKKLGARDVLATDVNPACITNARKNSKRLNLPITVKRVDLFGNIRKRFDVVTFNPPFTDFKAHENHEASFWDYRHRTVRRFFKDVKAHLRPSGRAFIAWSSFGKIKVLKEIAREYNYTLRECGRRAGKRGFVYYVYRIIQN